MRVLMGMPKKGLPGGPQGHLPYLVEGLRAAGHVVDERTYGSRTANPSMAGRLRLVLQDAGDFADAVRRTGYDVVHLNTAFDLKALLRDVVTVRKLRRWYQGCIFLKFHGSDLRLARNQNPILRAFSRDLFRRINGVGVLSMEERQAFVDEGFPASKLFIVKNILRPEEFVRDPGFNQRMEISNGTTILLFTGRMIVEKGLSDIVRALSIVKRKRDDFLLLCLGDGPDRAKAETLSAELSLTTHVRFLGYIPESATVEYYANASLLVFPTYHQEGFPMTVFRSVAAGLPVITTRIRAAADYLKEPDNCLWVDPTNPEQLAQKILTLMEDKELAARMSELNRAMAERFDATHVTKEFVGIYLRLCAIHT
jgi:glycosyltransferase involved in cell wall biosynthesis